MKEVDKKQGEPITICISGMTGCGKSTAARRLAQKFELRYISGGDALKSLAAEEGYEVGGSGWWESEEGMRFFEQRIEDPEFDKRVDQRLLDWAQRGRVVLDSWTMPWLFDGGFKVWLEASQEVRAKRLARRDGMDVEHALQVLKEKDDRTRRIYSRLYGFRLGEDLSPFQVILDVNLLDADEVFDTLCLVVDRWLLGRR
ncbi:AAA family ATPase [Candidatus Bathyarchaeota archaeon]|nr:AAA family ATPase [Candidatus Bathyarchaeota archaeon]NIU81622.1 AAA family ATPase [Candidatus Bathyarchaeota archaeon]NIV68267.1 AAA family ATPase [Candidatus Bathyarchaeota archaeon]NIW16608.1 AAA family ATPase [Candidatus Bathyarchaeota archaeon]NIW34808.1 AAA family ATPase [Candidatus Bathyarchaeota archaeon]